MGINFVWEDGYIEEVVERAYKMNTGGRAVKNIINRSLDLLDSEVNNHKDEIKTIFIPKSSLDNPKSIVLIKKDNEPVLLETLIEETKRKNEELKRKKEIKVNEEAKEEAVKIYKKLFNK